MRRVTGLFTTQTNLVPCGFISARDSEIVRLVLRPNLKSAEGYASWLACILGRVNQSLLTLLRNFLWCTPALSQTC